MEVDMETVMDRVEQAEEKVMEDLHVDNNCPSTLPSPIGIKKVMIAR